jgi:D-3-phosphoglycerate dehydrogenase
MRFIGVSRSGRPVDAAQRVVRFEELASVLPQADAVVLAAPATAETAKLIGHGELAAMSEHAWLINVARGALVDTDALVEALAAGSIGGAALDVTDPEPLPDGHPLWTEPRALITPHRANFGEAADAALFALITRQIQRWVAGEELSGRVDTARGY